MKICPVGTELFHEDGRKDTRMERQTNGRMDRWTYRRTDMTNLIAPFRNFVNALNKDGNLADPRNSFQI
jgi:hypothetical protein